MLVNERISISSGEEIVVCVYICSPTPTLCRCDSNVNDDDDHDDNDDHSGGDDDYYMYRQYNFYDDDDDNGGDDGDRDDNNNSTNSNNNIKIMFVIIAIAFSRPYSSD